MSEQQIDQLTQQLEKLEKQYEDLRSSIELIDHKHENVMSSVLEHLVYQSNVLMKQVHQYQGHTTPDLVPDDGIVCSAEYREILQHEHNTPNKWGVAAKSRFADIVEFIKKQQYTDILDYGAGSANRLSGMLESEYPGEFACTDYDPGIPEISQNAVPHSLVTCIDVLEHVEPELLDNVLSDLQRVTLKAGYFVISTVPASRILNNGKNAHLIVQPTQWWINQLEKRFSISHYSHQQGELLVTVTPK